MPVVIVMNSSGGCRFPTRLSIEYYLEFRKRIRRALCRLSREGHAPYEEGCKRFFCCDEAIGRGNVRSDEKMELQGRSCCLRPV